MPEQEFAKVQPHPFAKAREGDGAPSWCAAEVGYAELAVTSNYTFLTGASHPEEMVERAAELGYRAAAIADTNTLAGIVRAHIAAKEAGIPLAVGCRLALTDVACASVLVFAMSRKGYSGLCRLLTLGKRRAPKGECYLGLEDVCERNEGLLAVALPGAEPDASLGETLRRLRQAFDDDRLSLAAWRSYGPEDEERVRAIAAAGQAARVPLVAINDAHYHDPSRRALQDVLTCIRHGCTIEEAGFKLHANAERHLKAPEEMARLFAPWPRAVMRSVEVAERAAAFSMDELKYEYPAEPCPPGMNPTEYLHERAWAGAAWRYPGGVPEKVRKSLEDELAIITELRYEPYFLTCYDIVTFARDRGILCQGRGGAANSAVCYCLGITEVNPNKSHLLFARFISRQRGEPPDIDIDFEHERREEVIQYLYEKYGRDRAALTAEVITYRGRSAVREVGKAMGLSLDAIDVMAKNLSGWSEGPSDERVRECGFNPQEPTIRRVITLTQQLIGFPRHLSQHVGGFVITKSPLSDLVPIENAAMDDRTVIEWDKDDIDAMRMLKVDVLGLGMLTCVRKAFEFVGRILPQTMKQRAASPETAEPSTNAKGFSSLASPFPPSMWDRFPESIEANDARVYDMIGRADTVGVFQIESRAQMSMLPRLRPREFYDLVIEVAIVRPGPIQGKMVHPYLRRRNGEEEVTYPNEAIREVLGRTLGVPLFQEQAMQLSIVAAGFSADRADQLRRAMAAWKRKGDKLAKFGRELIDGMLERGYPLDFAQRCFEQIKGFSEYGFPESHAASFALLAYASCWLKRHHPAAFAAALINSQPMGFYAPAQIVRDAKEHGVEVRPIDANHSGWDCGLEGHGHPCPCADGEGEGRENGSQGIPDMGRDTPWGHGGPAIRLGMRLVSGLGEEDAKRVTEAVEREGKFGTVEALWRGSGVPVKALRSLARADAFGSMGLDRQGALWQIRPLRDESLPLFERSEGTDDAGLDALPPVRPGRRVLQDYEATGLSLKAHPMSFIRKALHGVMPNAELRDAKRCPERVSVAGIVLVRQRPSTASGVVFITLEDETGIANLVLWRDTFEKYRRVARLSTALLVRGKVERQGEVIHVHAHHLESLDERLPDLDSRSRDFH